MSFWDHVEFFSPDEFLCPCCGEQHMKESYVLTLDRIRTQYGAPLHPSSGYRCPDYNASMSKTGRDGPHTTGCASDFAVYGANANFLIAVALRNGITGIGLNQKGEYPKRFIHLDNLEQMAGRPRPWTWTY